MFETNEDRSKESLQRFQCYSRNSVIKLSCEILYSFHLIQTKALLPQFLFCISRIVKWQVVAKGVQYIYIFSFFRSLFQVMMYTIQVYFIGTKPEVSLQSAGHNFLGFDYARQLLQLLHRT